MACGVVSFHYNDIFWFNFTSMFGKEFLPISQNLFQTLSLLAWPRTTHKFEPCAQTKLSLMITIWF